uniref:Uncharacterized protein n=1 Tax=Lactuca sativa TaxID=4236 RepID=A0A9R1WKC8_LACSA|nr:hypothetical protein LSAT_V11C100028710 [Lactuca sativa]
MGGGTYKTSVEAIYAEKNNMKSYDSQGRGRDLNKEDKSKRHYNNKCFPLNDTIMNVATTQEEEPLDVEVLMAQVSEDDAFNATTTGESKK